MAQLEAFKLAGILLEMYPEDHSPPHFHVIKDNWNIRVKFNLSRINGRIVWDAKYPEGLCQCPLSGTELKHLMELIKIHYKSLNAQWKSLHPSKQDPRK